MNRCTLIVDMNWLLISRASVMLKQFAVNNPDNVLDAAQQTLKERLAESIITVLNRLTGVDNIVLIADGGSWRKHLEAPQVIKDVVYKGNRVKKEETDWSRIFHTLNDFMAYTKELGITCSQGYDIEGDDWAWYWSTRLNNEGVNCIIWSSDNDLKQLVKWDGEKNVFTGWYNAKAGLWLDEGLRPVEQKDAVDFFMAPIQQPHPVLETLSRWPIQRDYLHPFDIVREKILMGDSGDNFSRKDFEKILEEYSMNDMNELLYDREKIANTIVNMKKFKALNRDPKTIEEMIVFNSKLVWLNGRVIPKEIQEKMNQEVYNLYDLEYIRNNHKVLLPPQDNDIEALFEDLPL